MHKTTNINNKIHFLDIAHIFVLSNNNNKKSMKYNIVRTPNKLDEYNLIEISRSYYSIGKTGHTYSLLH